MIAYVVGLLAAVIAPLALLVGQISSDPTMEWLSEAGAVGVMAFALLALMRGWVVTASTHREVKEERDRALDLVYKQADIATRAIEAAARQGDLER